MTIEVSDIKVLILSGGKGTRLSSIVNDVPKPMADIKGSPFLKYLTDKLQNEGFDDITLLTGYKSEIIENFYKDETKINTLKERTPLGTGGAIRQALEYTDKSLFLVLNGDTFVGISFLDFIKSCHHQRNTLCLNFIENCDRYGTVETNHEGKVISFKEKQDGQRDSYINAGVYLLTREAIGKITPEKFSSLETDYFPYLNLYTKKYNGFFLDIGIPEDYVKAQDLIPFITQEQDR